MKTKCLFLLLAGFAAFSAAAQSPKTLQRLNRTYPHVGPFKQGLALVYRTGSQKSAPRSALRFGFVDTLGRVCIPLEWDYATDFSEAAAVVGVGHPDARKLGLIDRTGKQLTPCEWDGVYPMREGQAVVWKNGLQRRYALIDSLGNRIDLDCNYCKSFSEGLAVAGRGAWHESTGMQGEPASEFRGKCGFIDTAGSEAIAFKYDDARSFSEERAAVGIQGKYYVKWGYVAPSGELVVPCRYFDAEAFSNHRAVVCRIGEGGVPLYGYVDPFGNEVIPCRYAMATPFRFVNAWVGTEEEDGEMAYMLIDPAGREVMTYKVYDLNDSGGYGHASCAVRQDGRLWYGVVDNRGRVVVPFEYDRVTIFSAIDPLTGKKEERGIADRGAQKRSFTLTRPPIAPISASAHSYANAPSE